jgi:hypothetical protein
MHTNKKAPQLGARKYKDGGVVHSDTFAFQRATGDAGVNQGAAFPYKSAKTKPQADEAALQRSIDDRDTVVERGNSLSSPYGYFKDGGVVGQVPRLVGGNASPPIPKVGKITGEGTGTSDSIGAKLPVGDAIIPADKVKALGADFFDKLVSIVPKPESIGNAPAVEAQVSNGEFRLPGYVVKYYGNAFVNKLIGDNNVDVNGGKVHAASGVNLNDENSDRLIRQLDQGAQQPVTSAGVTGITSPTVSRPNIPNAEDAGITGSPFPAIVDAAKQFGNVYAKGASEFADRFLPSQTVQQQAPKLSTAEQQNLNQKLNKDALFTSLSPEQQAGQIKAGNASVARQLADPGQIVANLQTIATPSEQFRGQTTDGVYDQGKSQQYLAGVEGLKSRLQPEQLNRLSETAALQRKQDLAGINAGNRIAAENDPVNQDFALQERQGNLDNSLQRQAYRTAREESTVNPVYDINNAGSTVNIPSQIFNAPSLQSGRKAAADPFEQEKINLEREKLRSPTERTVTDEDTGDSKKILERRLPPQLETQKQSGQQDDVEAFSKIPKETLKQLNHLYDSARTEDERNTYVNDFAKKAGISPESVRLSLFNR